MILITQISSLAIEVRLNGFHALRSRDTWRTSTTLDATYWGGSSNWLQITPKSLPPLHTEEGDVCRFARVEVGQPNEQPTSRLGDHSEILVDAVCRPVHVGRSTSLVAQDRISGGTLEAAQNQTCDFRFPARTDMQARVWEIARETTPHLRTELLERFEYLRELLLRGDRPSIQSLFATCVDDRARIEALPVSTVWEATGIPMLLDSTGDWIAEPANSLRIRTDPSGRVSWIETATGKSPFRRRSRVADVVTQLHVSWCLFEGNWVVLV